MAVKKTKKKAEQPKAGNIFEQLRSGLFRASLLTVIACISIITILLVGNNPLQSSVYGYYQFFFFILAIILSTRYSFDINSKIVAAIVLIYIFFIASQRKNPLVNSTHIIEYAIFIGCFFISASLIARFLDESRAEAEKIQKRIKHTDNQIKDQERTLMILEGSNAVKMGIILQGEIDQLDNLLEQFPKMINKLVNADDLDDIFQTWYDFLIETLGMSRGIIYMSDVKKERLFIWKHYNTYIKKPEQFTLSFNDGLAGWCAKSKHTELWDEVKEAPIVRKVIEESNTRTKLQSILCSPIVIKGKVRAVIDIHRFANDENLSFKKRIVARLSELTASLMEDFYG